MKIYDFGNQTSNQVGSQSQYPYLASDQSQGLDQPADSQSSSYDDDDEDEEISQYEDMSD